MSFSVSWLKRVKYKKNKGNTLAYQGKKPESKSTGNTCLPDLNRFNTPVYSS